MVTDIPTINPIAALDTYNDLLYSTNELASNSRNDVDAKNNVPKVNKAETFRQLYEPQRELGLCSGFMPKIPYIFRIN